MPKKQAATKRKRSAGEVAEEEPPRASKSPDVQASTAASASAAGGATFSSLPDTLTDPGWRELMKPLFQADSWGKLTAQLDARRAAGEVIYPPVPSVFRAFNLTALEAVRVVILGQDPYHGPGQADGLAFSFSGGGDLPPSLKNIFKELQEDIAGFAVPKSGSLEAWARQGVLLLNTALTVAEHKPGSHAKLGWTEFTDGLLSLLCRQSRRPIVFLLWGKPAQSKEKLLLLDGNKDSRRVTVLKAAHPSPAAGGAFSGCRHFSKANAALGDDSAAAIDWRLA